jgi:hypothetical protein
MKFLSAFVTTALVIGGQSMAVKRGSDGLQNIVSKLSHCIDVFIVIILIVTYLFPVIMLSYS